MSAETLFEALDDKRREAFERAWQHVPLSAYDDYRKPSEEAFGEMVAERDRLADALQAIIDQDTRPFQSWAAYIYFIRDIAHNALTPPKSLLVGKYPKRPDGNTAALHD